MMLLYIPLRSKENEECLEDITYHSEYWAEITLRQLHFLDIVILCFN
jgi:hypothetical protein